MQPQARCSNHRCVNIDQCQAWKLTKAICKIKMADFWEIASTAYSGWIWYIHQVLVMISPLWNYHLVFLNSYQISNKQYINQATRCVSWSAVCEIGFSWLYLFNGLHMACRVDVPMSLQSHCPRKHLILFITTFLSSESLIKLSYPIMVLGIVLSRPRYKIMNCVIFCPYVCLNLCFYSTVLVIDVYRLHDNMSVCLHMLLSSTKKLILYHEIIFFDRVPV